MNKSQIESKTFSFWENYYYLSIFTFFQFFPLAWLFQLHAEPNHLHRLQSRVPAGIQEAALQQELARELQAQAPTVENKNSYENYGPRHLH